MIEFNSNHIVVGEIKQLLKECNLPSCKILVEGEKANIYEDLTYIYNNQLLKSKITKQFKDENGFTYNEKDFSFIEPIDFNEKILNITHNTLIKNNYYDSYTHEELGNYLRYIRDFRGLDLMSMYNCFNGSTASGVNIDIHGENNTLVTSFMSERDDYKLYVVPVKFNKKYTIAIDSLTNIQVVPVFYRDGNLITKILDDNKDILLEKDFYKKGYSIFGGVRFNQPVVYDKLYNILDDNSFIDSRRKLENKENELKLLIKVPFSNTSSLVVLEGDYSSNNKRYFYNTNGVWNRYFPNELSAQSYLIERNNLLLETSDDELLNVDTIAYSRIINANRQYRSMMTNKNSFGELSKVFDDYSSSLQLLYLNDETHHPFADRLIEYLTENVITPLDDIYEDVKRVEVNLNKYTPHYIYNNDLRLYVYLESLKKGLMNTNYDLLGYVDKDVESKVVGDYKYSDTLEV